MKKKYIVPQSRVIPVSCNELLAGSGYDDSTKSSSVDYTPTSFWGNSNQRVDTKWDDQ